MLKIYFAGSIRRGRADAAIYNQDSAWLKAHARLNGSLRYGSQESVRTSIIQ